jgi:hypothetical protein
MDASPDRDVSPFLRSGAVNMVRVLSLIGVLLLGWFLVPILTTPGGVMDTVEDQDRPGFAETRTPQQVTPVEIDGKRTIAYLNKICDLGPRMSATKQMQQQQDLIIKHFEGLGATVRKQTFMAKQLSRQNPVEMTNIIVSWNPERKRRVILCSHYDTRPIADQEPNPQDWRKPFVSANDGGSGVALMMELGHHMKDLKTTVGVDFVFFDGEEFVFNRTDDYFFGSKHFAQTWLKNQRQPEYLGAVLLDMIGGKNAQFPWEDNSRKFARPLVDQIWKIAKELKCTAFKNEFGHSVLDDHIALLNVGIPAIDIIDFDYAHWHKLTDTPANCSADSMAQVARVLTTWVQRAR